jgi:hypothetical protein
VLKGSSKWESVMMYMEGETIGTKPELNKKGVSFKIKRLHSFYLTTNNTEESNRRHVLYMLIENIE